MIQPPVLVCISAQRDHEWYMIFLIKFKGNFCIVLQVADEHFIRHEYAGGNVYLMEAFFLTVLLEGADW